jgi:hypothetical protein
MSFLPKSYQDNLRALKKEQQELADTKEEKTPLDDTNLFASYLFDLSDEELLPIERILMYKKMYAIKHNYVVPNDGTNLPIVKLSADPFQETSIFLPPIIGNEPIVNQDFLTGYYLAQTILPKDKTITSYHAGLSSDNLTRGIFHAFAKQKNIKWKLYGCDRVIRNEYRKVYINGVSKKCNVFDLNSIRSINIQIGETIKPKSLNFYISDVRTQSTADVLMQYFLCYGYVSDNGYTIIRLPNNWQEFYTSMVTTMIYFISQYDYIKIFKTPWGEIPKFYLIFARPKEVITQAKINNIVSYIEALKTNSDLPLFNEAVFDIDEDPTSTETLKDKNYMELLVDNINNTYKQLIMFNLPYTTTQANQICLELVNLT